MDFQLEEFHRDVPTSELVADLRRAQELLRAEGQKLTFRAYANTGKFSASTIAERFGSWNKALAAAGIDPNEEKNITVDALFENLRQVWLAKGKQPVFRDLAEPPSRYRGQHYSARFGGWRNALREFVMFVKSDDWLSKEERDCERRSDAKNLDSSKARRGRSISLRMRFRILLRDNFKCQACGATPANEPGVELHVDHILPWSKRWRNCGKQSTNQMQSLQSGEGKCIQSIEIQAEGSRRCTFLKAECPRLAASRRLAHDSAI